MSRKEVEAALRGFEAGLTTGRIQALEEAAEWLEDSPDLPRWMTRRRRMRGVDWACVYIAGRLRVRAAQIRSEHEGEQS